MGNLTELSYCILDGGRKNLPDSLLVLELNLCFGGMNVDINRGRADFEVYEIRYVRTIGYQSVVGLHDGLMEIGVLHEAPVDEEVFVGTFPSGCLGFGGKAGNLAKRRLYVDR